MTLGVDLDDLMDEEISDSEGRFELKGHETELSNIDPKVNIYHVSDEIFNGFNTFIFCLGLGLQR